MSDVATRRSASATTPTARAPAHGAEAAASRPVHRFEVGPLSLAGSAPGCRRWCRGARTEDGFVTRRRARLVRALRARAAGAIVVEATGIRDMPSGPLLRIGHDRFVPGLRQLVDAVRERQRGETRLFIQIIDFLRIRAGRPREKFFGASSQISRAAPRALRSARGLPPRSRCATRARRAAPTTSCARVPRDRASSRRSSCGYRERVTDMHLPHIRELPQRLPGLFAAAARARARPGFDGVELHYAHAYTMASFLSALNTRDDGYGGSREHRVRLPLEVFARGARRGRRRLRGRAAASSATR